MNRKYNKQLIGECIEMVVGLGMTDYKVGKKMNVPYQTVKHWVSAFHIGRCKVRSHNTIDIITKTWKS